MYLKGDLTQFMELVDISMKINREIGDSLGIADNLVNIGAGHFAKGEYTQAVESFEQSLKIYEAKDRKEEIVAVFANIAAVYGTQGNTVKALQVYERSLKISEEIGDNRATTSTLNNLGVLYSNQGDYAKAMDYYRRTLAIAEELGNKSEIAKTLANLGICSSKQDQYTESLEYFNRALEINEELDNKTEIGACLSSMASNYKSQGNYAESMKYFQEAEGILAETGDVNLQANTFIGVGDLNLKLGNYTEALASCKKGLALTEDIGVLRKQMDACNCLYETYKALGNGNEALAYIERVRSIEDSLNTEETGRKLMQLEYDRQVYRDSVATVEKERLIEEAHQEEVRKQNQTRNILLGAGGLLFLLAGGVYSRLQFVRKSKAVLQVEKDRSESLLLNILPEEIAQELKENGKAAARDFELVSILFTDFKGFTEKSAALSATDLVSEINHCFEAFDHIMEKYNIEKIKTIGDAYMAAGGLPVPTDESTKNTVLAALEMQDFILKRKADLDVAGKPAFEMRVGIHTGPVVAGIVGVKKFQYDIWGDTVNTASRIESNGSVGKVNVSQATYELLKDDSDFLFESRGKIAAKGKGKMEMFFVSKK